MLKNNFFYIKQITRQQSNIISDITLNAAHGIFEGHFPGQPVVPGVCMLQMQREILEEALGIKLQLKESSMIKFLTMLVPTQYDAATFNMDIQESDHALLVTSTLTASDVVFLKFKGSYTRV